MDVTAFQIRYKYADYNFNIENIKNHLDFEGLGIFPSLNFDCERYFVFFEQLAKENQDKVILIGTYLLKNGEFFNVEDEFFEFCDKTVYVSEKFVEDIDCDLYVLVKNGYFTINGSEKLVENIISHTDFVFVNPIMMADENIYAGKSFCKNRKNELVMQMAICEEQIEKIDFEALKSIEKSDKQYEIFEVLKFALKEYMENTGFKQVVLGLSGGIDSALTSVIAKEAIGAENVYTIMLPSIYSSKGSIDDSLELAKNIGINVKEIPITPLFNCYLENIAKEKKGDVAEENLQSRLRGVILMFESNRNGYLLLSTGNKSEVAMGYGTLYGDMCGGLNLIADLTKTSVYELANWINREKIVIPENIIKKAPSAELRPNQKDEDSLPPYAILDEVINMYIEEKLPKETIYEKYDKSFVDEIIRKICKNEFKRRQACLGIRLSENSFCSNVKFPM